MTRPEIVWYYVTAADFSPHDIDVAPCAVCRRPFNEERDTAYYPASLTTEQETLIEATFGCDPYADFLICQECLEPAYPPRFIKGERLRIIAKWRGAPRKRGNVIEFRKRQKRRD